MEVPFANLTGYLTWPEGLMMRSDGTRHLGRQVCVQERVGTIRVQKLHDAAIVHLQAPFQRLELGKMTVSGSWSGWE